MNLSEEMQTLKAQLLEKGVSSELADFIVSAERTNKVLNAEELDVNDRITIVGVESKHSEQTIQGVLRKWVTILTSGDRSSIGLSRLVGTAKVEKYFNPARKETLFCDNYANYKPIELPRREGDALVELLTNYKGKTLQVIAKAEGCGRDNSMTFYQFAIV